MLFSRRFVPRFPGRRFVVKAESSTNKQKNEKQKGKSKKSVSPVSNTNNQSKTDIEEIASYYTIFNSLNEDEHVFKVSEEIHRALEVSQSDFAHGIKILSDLIDQLVNTKEGEEDEKKKEQNRLLMSEVFLNMGIIYEDNGLIEGAGKSYEEAVKHNESNILALFHYAVFVQPIDPQDSLSHYHKLIQLDPNFIEAHINIGNIQMELHRPKEAVEAYEKAIQSKIPPSGDVGDEQKFFYESKALAHHNLGLFYYDNNNKKLAVKNFEMSITYNPKSLDSYECLANLYEVEGNAEAVTKYRNLIDTNFSDYVHNINYVEGKSFFEIGNYEEAKKCFEKALGTNDSEPPQPEKKKKNKMRANMNQLALEHSRMRNITLHKRNFMKDCYLLLAKTKQKLGDWEGSVNDLRALCKMDEDDSNSVIELALALRECNEIDESIRILRRLSVIENNNNPFTLYQLANMLAINEKLDQAVTYHLRAIEKVKMEKEEEKELLFKIYHNLSITYKRINDEENSSLYESKCQSLLESMPDLIEKMNTGQMEFGGEGIEDITEYEKEQESKHTPVEPVDITKKRFRIEEAIEALSANDLSISNKYKLIQDALRQDEKEGRVRDMTEEEMDKALENMSASDIQNFDKVIERALAEGAIVPLEKEEENDKSNKNNTKSKLKTKVNSNIE